MRRSGLTPAPITNRIMLSLAFASLLGCGNGSARIVFPDVVAREPDLTTGAILKGTCLFEGKAPIRRPIEMAAELGCRHDILDEPLLAENIVVTDGKLRDVFIHVTRGLEKWIFALETSEATIDQKDCAFVPHVIGVRRYQPVVFSNGDSVTHNVNTRTSALEQGFNRSLPSRGKSFRWQFTKNELSLKAHCNLHPWMRAWIHVVDHPYFSVTSENGRFRLPRKLPPGKYHISALHPELGTQEATVTIPENGTVTLDFTFRS